MSGWLRRNRSTLVIGLGTLAALVVAVLLSGGPRTGADHDPENPGARGARALARVLEDQGVEVDVVRSAAALEDRSLDADTTVVVTSPGEPRTEHGRPAARGDRAQHDRGGRGRPRCHRGPRYRRHRQ
ncbi:DUF4350 domain-containing protein [Nocardioides sp. B-3]|uniref:DUF4350 domain-containing protein n=1 Tax=Nocardioides sp. B-3 TaxID=2895565 RepID=UPI0021529C45|nr:DUF4350 domain-containing protein [Nocardioides sp. B-3]UUZ57840.1 DUF4350 domain-containing protein [Nocardioides sp. B-3]